MRERSLFQPWLAVLLSGKSFWLALAFLLMACGALFSWQYFAFVELQHQNIQGLSVFSQLLIPFFGGLLLVGMLLISLGCLLLFARLHQSSWIRAIAVSPKAKAQTYHPLWLVVSIALLPQLAVLPLLLGLDQVAIVDWSHWAWLTLGGTCVLLSYGSLALTLALRLSSALTLSLSLSGLLVIFYWLAAMAGGSVFSGINWLAHIRQLQIGLAGPEIFLLPAWAGLGVVFWRYQWLTWAHNFPASRWFLWGLLLLALGLSLGPTLLQPREETPNNDWQFDLTFDQRFSVSRIQQQKLAAIEHPVVITAVVNQAAAREEIHNGYRALRPWLKQSRLQFRQSLAEANQPSQAGEYLRIELDDKQQLLAYPFDRPAKEALIAGIEALMKRKQRFIAFVEGHQESTPNGGTGADFKLWAAALRQAGWPVVTVDLNRFKHIPDNTELLVIASSKKPWPPAHLGVIQNYLARGKHLLLLRDPGDSFPRSLSSLLGVDCAPGTLIDWRGYQSGTPHPAIVVARDFSAHPLTANLKGIVAMAWSCGLEAVSGSGYQVLIRADSGSWNELRADDENLMFAKDANENQQAWPLLVAREKSGQKIVVAGDSHFLSDSAINNYDNLQLGLNLASWLTSEPMVSARPVADGQVAISPLSRWLLGYLGFVVAAAPVLILFVVWQRQRTRQLSFLASQLRSGSEA